VVLAACSSGSSGSSSTTASTAAGSTTTTAPSPATTGSNGVDDKGFQHYAEGDCLTWDQKAANIKIQVVPCNAEHLVEVLGSVDISPIYNDPLDDYPSQGRLASVGQQSCDGLLRAYLGSGSGAGVKELVLTPTPTTWGQGDRMLWCAVGLTPVGGQRPPYTGKANDHPPGS
jgi:hypothetical protein